MYIIVTRGTFGTAYYESNVSVSLEALERFSQDDSWLSWPENVRSIGEDKASSACELQTQESRILQIFINITTKIFEC